MTKTAGQKGAVHLLPIFGLLLLIGGALYLIGVQKKMPQLEKDLDFMQTRLQILQKQVDDMDTRLKILEMKPAR